MKLNRRNALKSTMALGTVSWGWGTFMGKALGAEQTRLQATDRPCPRELSADVVIIGAGLGGCAAAMAASRNGLRVILTEPTDWIGGQLTSQAVPPDEHPHIETYGANQSYRELRSGIREYYRRYYPLTSEARNNPRLNPGGGTVSRLCHEPRVALAVLEGMLAPAMSGGRCRLLRECEPVSADVQGDTIRGVTVRSLRTGQETTLLARWFIDASELGDLLPMTGTEFVMGAESRDDTNELHAAEKADPLNQQAFTVCFAADYRAGEDHTIDRPRDYDFWSAYVPALSPPWPGRLLDLTYTKPRTGLPAMLSFDPALGKTKTLNLFRYRQIVQAAHFEPGTYAGDMTLVNWPQNDYVLGPLVGVTPEVAAGHLEAARQLSLSLLYWLQTTVPREDGGTGYPGLCLRPDVMGTEDGLAKGPYIRESRRLQALFRVTEEHVGRENRALVTGQPQSSVTAAEFPDSVGVGAYHIDLHPSSAGNNYIDFESLPFQIPLGALISRRMTNLLAANKNIGTTHLTNGCYRLHPVEWAIGEAAGCLTAFLQQRQTTPHAVHESAQQLADFQQQLRSQGVELSWPKRSG